jgi:hypothetical protein
MKKTLSITCIILGCILGIIQGNNAQTIAISDPVKGTVFSNGDCISAGR